MNPAYLDRLSPEVQTFVLEVERAAGIEIDVQLDQSRDNRGVDKAGILACDIDEHGAKLLVPNESYFPDRAVIHEMLHVRRILVDRVPRLGADLEYSDWSPHVENALTSLDNQLEHWIIVPEEIQRCSDSKDRWNGILEDSWRNDIPKLTDKDNQRHCALIHWAFLAFVFPHSSVMSIAKDVLASLDLIGQANMFVEAARAHLGNKEQLVISVFRHLRIPFDVAEFEYFDIAQRKTSVVPLKRFTANPADAIAK